MLEPQRRQTLQLARAEHMLLGQLMPGLTDEVARWEPKKCLRNVSIGISINGKGKVPGAVD